MDDKKNFVINNYKRYSYFITPPKGYELEFALGTTYTLELDVVLYLLSCFQGMKVEKLGDMEKNKNEYINSLIDASKNTLIFCNRGGIKNKKIPKIQSYLDESIKEIFIENGSFHPKIWLIKYKKSLNKTKKIFKLVSMSKNITKSNFWEISFESLGEQITEETTENKKLIEFLNILKNQIDHKSDRLILNKKNQISKMIEELKKVKFKTNSEADIAKILYGWPGKSLKDPTQLKKEFSKYSEILIISPFITSGFIQEIIPENTIFTLITNKEQLDGIEKEWGEFKKLFQSEENLLVFDTGLESNEDEIRKNLHAKIYIGKIGQNSSEMWIGSANATYSAWKNNCEIMHGLSYKGDLIKEFKENFIDQQRGEFCSKYIRADRMPPKPNEKIRKRELRELENKIKKIKYEINFNVKKNKATFKIKNFTNNEIKNLKKNDLTFMICEKEISLNSLILNKYQVNLKIDSKKVNLSGFILIEFKFYKEIKDMVVIASTNLHEIKEKREMELRSLLSKEGLFERLYWILHRNDPVELRALERRKNEYKEKSSKVEKYLRHLDLNLDDIITNCYRDKDKLNELLKEIKLIIKNKEFTENEDKKSKAELKTLKKSLDIIKKTMNNLEND